MCHSVCVCVGNIEKFVFFFLLGVKIMFQVLHHHQQNEKKKSTKKKEKKKKTCGRD